MTDLPREHLPERGVAPDSRHDWHTTDFDPHAVIGTGYQEALFFPKFIPFCGLALRPPTLPRYQHPISGLAVIFMLGTGEYSVTAIIPSSCNTARSLRAVMFV